MLFKTAAHVECERKLAAATEALANRPPHLIDITKNGRFIYFTFSNGVKIETLGMMSDDVQSWKDALL